MIQTIKNVAKSYILVRIGLVGIGYGILMIPFTLIAKLHEKLINI